MNVVPATAAPPPASRATAVRVRVWPSDDISSVAGDTATEVATWATSSVALPLAEPARAVIVVVPLPTDVAHPVASTLATEPSEDDHWNA